MDEILRKAAHQGSAAALVVLGYNYAEGDGVPQDLVRAAWLFRQEAAQGDAGGRRSRAGRRRRAVLARVLTTVGEGCY